MPDERRGLWTRTSPGAFELCAGREGDDAYVKLIAGETLTQFQLNHLGDVLRSVDWAFELAMDDAGHFEAAERRRANITRAAEAFRALLSPEDLEMFHRAVVGE